MFSCFIVPAAAAAKVASVVSDSVRPHGRQPTRLPHPCDSPGKNTGVGCHFLLQCMKVKSESEVAESCLTLSDPMDCGPPGSSVHEIFQARVLEWGANHIACFFGDSFYPEVRRHGCTACVSHLQTQPLLSLSLSLFLFLSLFQDLADYNPHFPFSSLPVLSLLDGFFFFSFP